MIPDTPWWTASSASSARKIPFTNIGREVILPNKKKSVNGVYIILKNK